LNYDYRWHFILDQTHTVFHNDFTGMISYHCFGFCLWFYIVFHKTHGSPPMNSSSVNN